MADYGEAELDAVIEVAIDALRTLQVRAPKGCLLACGFVAGVEQVTRDKMPHHPIKKPSQAVARSPKRSKKQRIEEQLRNSDLTAQETGRDDIEYGHHDSLPRGEHVARLRKVMDD